MRDWIIILVLYSVVLFGFGWLGGWRSAGRSIELWGRRSSDLPPGQGSSV